jgi:hypothetical protein
MRAEHSARVIIDRLKSQAAVMLARIEDDDPELALYAVVEAFITVRQEAQTEIFEAFRDAFRPERVQ